ncbi:ABC transporter permease [bacterium 1xD42-62]|uniref:ABC transporter permease n=2 Tax=Parablautia muri TaxID=2320879 RepID=A0A9X5GS29_9FIRM|nr:ABC transporter permease [Parablautia muri]
MAKEKINETTNKKRKKQSRFISTFKRVFETVPAKTGGILLIFIIALCVLAPVFAGCDPNEMDMANALAKPSLQHLCGTDNLGRDQWARILYGGRYSLALGIIGSLFAAVGGTSLGVIAGYFGGQTENLIMRFCDVWSAIPGTLLCIVISTALGPGFFNTIIALSIGAVPNGARMTRGQILAERTKEYLEAAEAMNCSKVSIMFKHLLPNVISPTIVGTTMGIGATITQAATLSYIGLGVQPPTPEWGAMLSAGKSYVTSFPHLLLYPGIAIGLTTLAINLMGDGLRDALDPKLRK